MNRKPYSAGAVKFSFWFMEFRKTVQLLAAGKSFEDIKQLNEQENIYVHDRRSTNFYCSVLNLLVRALKFFLFAIDFT